ncbi:MAG: hypothetical protein VYE22_19015, partial [Myxococcota bacterium]|nr:hypothetical protein [Myxococcota bacterium]
MSATPRASASRAFCDACHAAAAPHARPSSELLFTLPPPPSPDDARESVPLVELVARAPHPAPRDSLPYASTPWLHAPVVPAPRPRRNLAAALVIAVSAVALGASGALAMHVALGEPPEPEEVERDDAEGDPRAPGAAPPGPS